MQTAANQSPEPAAKTNLVEQYRAIGPAAILAALLHANKPAASLASKAA